MIYDVIASGSTGNAVVINDSVMIDCGVPYKALKHHVKRLQLVLLTHVHGDHFNPSTVRRLAHDRPSIRWGCCEWMVPHVVSAGVDARQIDVYVCGGTTEYRGAGLLITPVKLTHNVPNCGYKIKQRFIRGMPQSFHGSLFYATDTGTLEWINAKNYDIYMVEANHTRAEIEAAVHEAQEDGAFTYRIKAAENHLSEEQAVDWLAENAGPHSVWLPMHRHQDKGGADHGGKKDVCEDNRLV